MFVNKSQKTEKKKIKLIWFPHYFYQFILLLVLFEV